MDAPWERETDKVLAKARQLFAIPGGVTLNDTVSAFGLIDPTAALDTLLCQILDRGAPSNPASLDEGVPPGMPRRPFGSDSPPESAPRISEPLLAALASNEARNMAAVRNSRSPAKPSSATSTVKPPVGLMGGASSPAGSMESATSPRTSALQFPTSDAPEPTAGPAASPSTRLVSGLTEMQRLFRSIVVPAETDGELPISHPAGVRTQQLFRSIVAPAETDGEPPTRHPADAGKGIPRQREGFVRSMPEAPGTLMRSETSSVISSVGRQSLVEGYPDASPVSAAAPLQGGAFPDPTPPGRPAPDTAGSQASPWPAGGGTRIEPVPGPTLRPPAPDLPANPTPDSTSTQTGGESAPEAWAASPDPAWEGELFDRLLDRLEEHMREQATRHLGSLGGRI